MMTTHVTAWPGGTRRGQGKKKGSALKNDEKLRKGERTRRTLKKAALQLFAERGLNNVSIRDIQVAAGQKNNGSITYYFASRDALIRELVTDVGKVLDAANNERLDALEAAGGPKTLREVTDLLLPSFPLPDTAEDETADYSMRFFSTVLISHRDLLFEATAGQDRATRRIYAHIRRLAPQMPAELLQQRLMLVLLYSLSAGASMEAAQADHQAWKHLWGNRSARSNLIDTMTAIITGPVSEETMGLVDMPKLFPQ